MCWTVTNVPFVVAVALLLLDRALKVLASIIPPVRADFSFAEFAFKATPTTNVLGIIPLGSAFSLPLVSVAFVSLAVWIFLHSRHEPHTPSALPSVLVLLGGASNVYDRLATGAVTDVFRLALGANAIVFNLADIMIMVGVVCSVKGIGKG